MQREIMRRSELRSQTFMATRNIGAFLSESVKGKLSEDEKGAEVEIAESLIVCEAAVLARRAASVKLYGTSSQRRARQECLPDL